MSHRLRRLALSPFVIMPVVGLVAVGAWFQLRPDDDAATDEAATAPTEQIVAASLGTMEQTVTAEGTVAAAETEELSFSSSGRVTSVEVVAGDEVRAGDVLAAIDAAELEAAVAEAESSVADAEASYDELLDTDDVSDAQLAASESSLEVARDQLDAAEEARDGAQLVATMDGTVASVDITVGEELVSGTGGTGTTGSESGSGLSAADLGSGGAALPGAQTDSGSTETAAHIELVSTDLYEVELTFDDTDIANLEVGQVAGISVATGSSSGFPGGGAFPGGGVFPGGGAFPGGGGATPDGGDGTEEEGTEEEPTGPSVSEEPDAEGLLTEVGTVADASSGVASYPVTVVFSDDGGELIPGTTASVEIAYAETGEVVQVPSRAVTTEGGTSTVTVDLDGEAGGDTEERTVTTGMTSGSMTEIAEGLEAGEHVVMSLGGGAGAGGGGFTPPEGFELPQGGAGPEGNGGS
ncbi:MAG TPA: biotin/lipoyl-binding protein [Iamia sp.]